MSEEANKHKLRRLIEATERHFGLPKDQDGRDENIRFRLDGNPFHLEFCDGYQTWKIRCVIGAISKHDIGLLAGLRLPSYFRKAIAFRPEDNEKGLGIITIK